MKKSEMQNRIQTLEKKQDLLMTVVDKLITEQEKNKKVIDLIHKALKILVNKTEKE